MNHPNTHSQPTHKHWTLFYDDTITMMIHLSVEVAVARLDDAEAAAIDEALAAQNAVQYSTLHYTTLTPSMRPCPGGGRVIAMQCTVLYRIVPYRTVPYRTVPYRTVLHCSIAQCNVVYCDAMQCNLMSRFT